MFVFVVASSIFSRQSFDSPNRRVLRIPRGGRHGSSKELAAAAGGSSPLVIFFCGRGGDDVGGRSRYHTILLLLSAVCCGENREFVSSWLLFIISAA
jgi:hypothetical protein